MDRKTATFAAAISDLKSRMGVDFKDLKPAEVCALVHACDRAADPFREVNADAAGFPVRVADGVYFWKLTIGASVWLDHVETLLPKGAHDPRYKLALIYAVSHARDPKAFEMDDLSTIEKTVKRHFRKICATVDEINIALDILFKLKPDTRKRDCIDAATDWASLCARLETQTGIPAKEWIWNHSSSYAVKCYNDLHDFAASYCAAGGRSSAHMRDELDEAVNALQLLKVTIMKRVKGEI